MHDAKKDIPGVNGGELEVVQLPPLRTSANISSSPIFLAPSTAKVGPKYSASIGVGSRPQLIGLSMEAKLPLAERVGVAGMYEVSRCIYGISC